MRSFSVLGLAMIAAACATSEPLPEDVMSRPPPSLESLKREIDQALPCQPPGGHSVRRAAENSRRPQRLSECPQVFPEVLQSAGFVGTCRSMFDLDDTGAPVRVEARCAVENQYMYGNTPAAWVSLAEQAMAYASVKAVSAYRYNPASEATVDQIRDNLGIATAFALPGSGSLRLALPGAFQRPPPAPPLPADLSSLVSG
jgi:hypothetical protein